MKEKEILLEEVYSKLLEYTGVSINFSDAFATIQSERFAVDVKTEITQGSKGCVIQQLKNTSKEKNLPILLVARYIPAAIAKYFVAEGVSYIDAAGNCHIRQNSLLLIIEGKKMERLPKKNQPRAFQEAGIKLIYCLLANPDNLNKSFRELSELSQIALGSVSAVIRELVDLNFILKTERKKVLKNRFELLQRWVTAYNDVLRPKLFIKKMSFVNKSDYINWHNLTLSFVSEKTLWGGECAANILTKRIIPASFTIYTDETWRSVGKILKLIPDEDGRVELLRLFNKSEEQETVSPLLIYADLMNSGESRNLETAEIILNNELQYLK